MKPQLLPLYPPVVLGDEPYAELEITRYADGNPALVLRGAAPECQAVLSVNLPEHQHLLLPYQFFVKTWSEGELPYELLVERGVLVPTPRRIPCGFAEAVVCTLARERCSTVSPCDFCGRIVPRERVFREPETGMLYCTKCHEQLLGDGPAADPLAGLDQQGDRLDRF